MLAGVAAGELVTHSGPSAASQGYHCSARCGAESALVQARTVRDVAAMLDCLCVPEPGDPFVIPKPERTYAAGACLAVEVRRNAPADTLSAAH